MAATSYSPLPLSSSASSPYLGYVDSKKGWPLLDCVVHSTRRIERWFDERLRSPYHMDHYYRGGHLTSFILSYISIIIQGYTIFLGNYLTHSFRFRDFLHTNICMTIKKYFFLWKIYDFCFCSFIWFQLSQQVYELFWVIQFFSLSTGVEYVAIGITLVSKLLYIIIERNHRYKSSNQISLDVMSLSQLLCKMWAGNFRTNPQL